MSNLKRKFCEETNELEKNARESQTKRLSLNHLHEPSGGPEPKQKASRNCSKLNSDEAVTRSEVQFELDGAFFGSWRKLTPAINE